MIFLQAARAALSGKPCLNRIQASLSLLASLILAAGLFSCGNSYTGAAPSHYAYVTLPQTGNVMLLQIDGATGSLTVGPETPAVQNATTIGLALLPSKKFLYGMNSFSNTISIFSVASDGTLSLTGTPMPSGNGPYAAAIDPSGKYLLVTNSYGSNSSGGDISVYSIDSGSGALTEVAGSPFPANADPSEILIAPTGKTVYVTNPAIGMVTAFSFSGGVLAQLSTSPVFSGKGATGLAMDATGRFLFVANPLATNSPPYSATLGNITGFNIDPSTGGLSSMLGSPFAATSGNAPTQVAIDPGGRFLYATTPGSGDSIWCFTIDPTSGQLIATTSSPFSLAAGAQFALFDPTGGRFYIGNANGSAIEAYTYNPSTGALTAITGSPFSVSAQPGKMVFSE